MSTIERYNQIFMNCFELQAEQLNAELLYNSIELWDSVGHMAMIAEIEEVFDIMMDTEDIIDFSSYEKGQEILRKYDINF